MEIYSNFFYIPELEPVNLRFYTAGYKNRLSIENLGTLFLIIIGQFILVMIHILLFLFSLVFIKIERVSSKLSYYLYFTGTIRLLMEGYIEIIMLSLVNI